MASWTNKQRQTRADNMHRANMRRTELAFAKLNRKAKEQGLTAKEQARLEDMLNRLIGI